MTKYPPLYETKTVKTVRGTEKSFIKKWESQGWELVDQEKGRVQTTLNFRKPKKEISPQAIIAGVVIVLILALIFVIGIFTENRQETSAPASVAPSSALEQPSTSTMTPAPTPTESPVITVENNANFAKIMSTPEDCSEVYAEFTEKYAGQTIEFDGSIAYLAPHGDYKTRDDILIMAGDYRETNLTGPQFKYEDVNVATQLHFPVNDSGKSIGKGDSLHFVAKVERYETDPNKSCIFYLEPVSTTRR
ncbi:DUF4839 domain-containing protein [uncultured Rothia sp.]|uniref:DUF4839 domain-containing protein n=1 Tax=uncultured Rothia sp. TaxID=316088 RepID=UPI0032163B4A